MSASEVVSAPKPFLPCRPNGRVVAASYFEALLDYTDSRQNTPAASRHLTDKPGSMRYHRAPGRLRSLGKLRLKRDQATEKGLAALFPVSSQPIKVEHGDPIRFDPQQPCIFEDLQVLIGRLSRETGKQSDLCPADFDM